MNGKDLFIRRVYQSNGIRVVVDINLLKQTITLVEPIGNGSFRPKKWLFAERELRYMEGWLNILDAMKYAIVEASKLLEEAKVEEYEKMAKVLAKDSL